VKTITVFGLIVSDRLEAPISGSGSVEYAGSPVVQEQVSGLGGGRPIEAWPAGARLLGRHWAPTV
jgi:hypothetical protein